MLTKLSDEDRKAYGRCLHWLLSGIEVLDAQRLGKEEQSNLRTFLERTMANKVAASKMGERIQRLVTKYSAS
jgi:hypothetical protein